MEPLIKIVESYPKVITSYDVSGYSLLYIAAEQNNKDILVLLKAGATMNACYYLGGESQLLLLK